QALGINRILDQDKSLVDREWLFQKVVRTQLCGAHRRLNRPVPRNHNDLGSVFLFANPFQRFQAVDSGQPDIQQYHVELLSVQDVEAGLAALRQQGFETLILQYVFERLADRGFIVNDENVMHVDWRKAL